MNIIKILIIGLFIPMILFVGNGIAADTAAKDVLLPREQGIYKLTLELPDGTSLRYALSLPGKISASKPVPLVLALHYYGGMGTPWLGYNVLTGLVEPALKELGAIIIAPDCPGKHWEMPVSDSAAMSLVNFIKEHYPVDMKRVLVTGFSMGGMGTWYMIARYPHFFAASVSVSGPPHPKLIDYIENSTPVYVIHSNTDEVYPFKPLEEMIQKLKARGCPIELVVLDGISHSHMGKFVEPLRRAIPWIKKNFDH